MTLFKPCIALTGGGTGALDKLDGNILSDGDAAMVLTADGVYWYYLNATSSAVENSPFRINPDNNAGTKSWHLVGSTVFIGAIVSRSAAQEILTSSVTPVSFTSEDKDVGGWWDSGLPTLLTVPIGVDMIRVSMFIKWEASGSGYRYVNVSGTAGVKLTARYNPEDDSEFTITAPQTMVSAGNTAILNVYHTVSGGLELKTPVFSVEALEFS